MVIVSGINNIVFSNYRVEVDEYVPLRFRAYEGTLGVRYYRLGNFNTSLLELLLDQISSTVIGITLTAFDSVHEPIPLKSIPTIMGVPVLDVAGESYHTHGPIGAQRIDIPEVFSVGIGEDFVEIDLGRLFEAKEIVKSGPVNFYTHASSLVGIRVLGLSQEQITILKTYQHDLPVSE